MDLKPLVKAAQKRLKKGENLDDIIEDLKKHGLKEELVQPLMDQIINKELKFSSITSLA